MTTRAAGSNVPDSSDDPPAPGNGSSENPDRAARRWAAPPETALGYARRSARFIPLIQAWTLAGPERAALTVAERDLLVAIQLSVRRKTNLLIRLPGGIHRLPLLAAVMIAAETLHLPQGELSRISGTEPPPGPVALVTPRLVRRAELDRLDVSSAPVAPALHPHRLRGDGLASPLRGGKPCLVTGAARLLFVSPASGFPPVVGMGPRVVIIDASAEPGNDWIAAASNWAAAHQSLVITVLDLHEEVSTRFPVASREGGCESAETAGSHNTWIADWPWLGATSDRLAGGPPGLSSGGPRRVPAGKRGQAHLLAVDDVSLSGLAEVRERLRRLRDPRGGPAPWPVCRAARLARLLTELPTRTADYDRVAPRHGGRTLRRFLDDVLDADSRNDFPASWRARVAAEWGAVRVALVAVYDALSEHNPVTDIIADLVEDAARRGQQLDVVCGSRTARDALTGRLVSIGSLPIHDTPPATIRSINMIDAAGSHQSTLLIGVPAVAWRRRLAAADIGQLIVVGRRGDEGRLYQALRGAFETPSRRTSLDTRCATLAALTEVPADEDELDGWELNLRLTTQAIAHDRDAPVSLPDHRALLAAAMNEPDHDVDLDIVGLETEWDDAPGLDDQDGPVRGRSVVAVPVVVQSTADEKRIQPATVFLLALATRVQRLRDDRIRLVPITEITAGMTLIGISEPERRSLFERIRPTLADQRPQVVDLLLQLWRVALNDALAISGSAVDLAERLTALGADITSSAVAQWADTSRIGPIDPRNVARIGSIAGSAVVAGEAARIAAVMRAVRIHHSTVGAALVKLARWHADGDQNALDHVAETLGPDIAEVAAELTAWKVIAVGEAVRAPVSGLRRPWSLAEAARLTRPIGDRGNAGDASDNPATATSSRRADLRHGIAIPEQEDEGYPVADKDQTGSFTFTVPSTDV
ncbi:hypothetical protein SAMN05421541_101522 [Actinoplanes philippinensis]|uniref:DISARM protein DrmE C-terminal domain-containing protein n=1 Tax=Actinoplanes philippinensis TaxID=35752 RepID=A0A1I2A5X7_9ACTN|nr:hypothetical protein SAMN05421541_101522 [Actinoplanes philippinensis]